MIIHDVQQQSEEWFALRAGIPSASNFAKIITAKGELSKQHTKYLYHLAGEKVTGKKEKGYTNAAIEHGVVTEDEARATYEFIKDVEVQEVGFCMSDDGTHGCSPDGLIGDDGMLEIKCPQINTHVEYLLKGKLPSTYFQQVQGQLFVTGRKWCDFMSYHPDMKPFIVRVEPDKKFHEALEKVLKEFCQQLDEVVKKVK